MYKLIIADDEILVCVGLQSMIDWEKYNIEIVGVAHNGAQLEAMIESTRPDIVITDIKMPVKNGLEVAEQSRSKYGRLPLFIILTSYEDFTYARAAIDVQAVDYLVKLELTPQSLEQSIRKMLTILAQHKSVESSPTSNYRSNLQAQQDKFFIRLFNNLFESKGQFKLHKEDLSLSFPEPAYVVVICRILVPDHMDMRGDKLVTLCSSTMEMVKNTVTTDKACYATSLDLLNFSITIPLSTMDMDIWVTEVRQLLLNMAQILHNYFNVTIIGSIGQAVTEPYLLRDSYMTARKCLSQAIVEQAFVFHTEHNLSDHTPTLFDFSAMRSEMRRAFEELDTNALHQIITALIDQFNGRQDNVVSAIDAACNVLFMAASMLVEGEQMINQLFEHEPEGYRSIYQMQSIDEVILWLTHLRDGICEVLATKKQSYKSMVVSNVQDYIKRNLNMKLTLHHVADVFNFSPNYLSSLFSKVAKVNFVEYVTEIKINAAKEMMLRGEGRIYEISQKLGYDSAFYFSKVFKKVEGISPREFIQRIELDA